jgi:WD40 repeat protein
MHSSQQDSLNLSLYEDQKNYRKLRKILRQIEHLVILPRNLNKEEENKVSKRKFYRDQLEALNLKYKNQSELLTDTIEKEAEISEPSSFLTNEVIEEKHLDTENIYISSTEIEGEKNENESHAEESCEVSKEITVTKKKNKKSKKSKKTVDIDELAQKMENIALESPESQEKNILVPKAQSQKLITTEKPKKYIPKISFSTQLIENAHEDLILSIDVCSESNLIVTAGRDTTIKVWNTEGVKLHSFGGHSKSITCLKFWPYKSYVIATENLKNEANEEIEYPNFEINDDGERETDDSRNKPLILSSSLDCTFRLWSIYKGKFSYAVLSIYGLVK